MALPLAPPPSGPSGAAQVYARFVHLGSTISLDSWPVRVELAAEDEAIAQQLFGSELDQQRECFGAHDGRAQICHVRTLDLHAVQLARAAQDLAHARGAAFVDVALDRAQDPAQPALAPAL